MLENLKFDHIGVATKNIQKELPFFEKFGYRIDSTLFEDLEQNIKGLFIISDFGPRLELLENLDSDGPLTNILAKKNKFYHFAYQTQNIQKDFDEIIADGAIVVSPIKNAVYYKKVAFLMMKNSMLVELVEY